MFIGDYLHRRQIYSPDALAIVDSGKEPAWRLSFADMNSRANRLANWLRDEAGVVHGDRVAILARDGVEHLDCFFACAKLGAVHTALNWRLHWRELADICAECRPKVLVYCDDFRVAVQDLRSDPRAQSIQSVLYLDGPGCEGDVRFEHALALAADTPAGVDGVTEETVAALIFTGGTTGLPKAAQITHRMIAWNTLNTVIHDLTHGDIYVNVFPMFHTGGLFVYTLPQIILGGTTVLMRQFEPQRVLSLLEKERATVFAAVPAMYQMLTTAANWNEVDLSALRFCTSGGAPLPVPLVQKYTAEKGIRFKQGFGMTEFGPGVFALAPEDAIRKAGSIGRPTFFTDAQIVDERNESLGPNQVGELLLKGPAASSGYYNNLQASNEAIDGEGWFHTGDLARADHEWYFTIVDRKKDMFISGGENVYPVEIEKALYENGVVHMCAVIGVPDEKWGEVGLACVVLKPGSATTGADLLDFLRDRLAGYKVPKRIQLLDQLPISGAGKILKRDLLEQYNLSMVS